MKRIGLSLLAALLITLLTVTGVFAQYTNGGFETGDFTGWTKAAFINKDFGQPLGAGGADLSAIVGGPAAAPLSLSDPNTGDNLRFPASGNYTARINSELSYSDGSSAGYPRNGNTISQTVSAVLDPADNRVHVRFNYAAVMVRPVHNPHEKDHLPYFRVRAINTSNGDDVLFDYHSYVGEPGKNWIKGSPFGTRGDYWEYLDWTSVDLASNTAHPVNDGDVILLRITAAGCSLGGHPGYVYLDDVSDSSGAMGLSIQAEGPATATAGSTITYAYTYRNDLTTVVDPVIVINPPTHVTFTTVSDTVHCSGTAPVICNFTDVAGGGTGSFTVTGTIASAAEGTTLVHDEYTIGATGLQTVSGSPVLTDVVADTAILSITASGPASVKPGDPYTYTMNYTADEAVSNAEVRLTLPGHTTFSSSDLGCTVAGDVATCDLGDLTAGSGSFVFTVQVDRLKKVGIPLHLDASSYSLSASGVMDTNGSTLVTADVLSPFADVPAGYWTLDYIQAIWAAGITNGCATNPLRYCPQDFTSRGEAAVLLERALGNFAPTPSPTGMFVDVPYPGLEVYTPFIEELYNDGITTGCTTNPLKYCPQDFITREEIAIFIQRAFNLTLPS